MVGDIFGGPAIGDIGSDIEGDAAHYRERAKYLRQMIETMPARPDRDRLEELADQYEQLADSTELRPR